MALRLLVVLASVITASASISPAGETLVVRGISYYVAPEAVSVIDTSAETLNSASSSGDLIPLTVIEDKSGSFTAATFSSIVENYTAIDDVFNTGFLEGTTIPRELAVLTNSALAIYLKHTGTSPAKVQYPLAAALGQYGNKIFMASRAYSSSVQIQGHKITGWRKELPAGPYFMSTKSGSVYQAYRLYTDVQGAFTEGLKPNTDGTFSVLSSAVSGVQSPTIGVPSRLYYKKTTAKPLAGIRIGVKDIYDIAGVKTSCGNRAYYELYPPANATGPAVQSLIDAGAVIVGKMKTSQFANGETATADWVDYHSPFNARGDGYQDPSSSSSGPGAGIGSYDWLDIGLGSDTGGSIRGPSEVNGCFGNRPSHGLVSLDGVMPLSPDLDTAGFLTRDPFLWHEAATTESDSILLEFLDKLSTFMNATTSILDYTTLWAQTQPDVAGNSSISQYLGYVYPVLIAQQQYQLVTLPFYNDFAAVNMGKRPFVDPAPLIRWSYGQNNWTASATEQALQNKTVFMDWWSSRVVLPSVETCSESIMIYPGSTGTPNYRNAYRR
jgi:hypothetical protein